MTPSTLDGGRFPYLDEDGRTDAERYLTDIYDGKIVTSLYMRKLADMMLPRFHEPYKSFHFDVQKALRPVQFIEYFTCYPEGEKQGQPFVLEPFQRSALELGFGFVDDDLYRQFRQVIMMIARKNGKALALDTDIPTPSGWRKMGDLHVGDVVFGQDGKPSTIVAESEIFDKPMYLVAFEDGSTIKASADHIWTVWDTMLGFDANWHDVTTVCMAEDFASNRYLVPLCDPVEYAEVIRNQSPYVMGVECVANDMDCKVPSPEEIGTVKQRAEFLSGMVDASMHFHATGDNNVSTCNADAAESVASLCASLGYLTWVIGRDGRYVCCFDDDAHSKSIVSIARIPNEPSKCIAIDNSSHLYLAGRHYTATHNSALMAGLGHFFLTSDNEPGAEVLCIANSERQAKRVFGHADLMRRKSPFLKSRVRKGESSKTGTSALNYDRNGSVLVSIAANVDTVDGYSASAYIYDEMAACKDQGALLLGIEESVASRRQSSGWVISSENYVRHNIWDTKIDHCKAVLDGKIEDDRVLPILYSLDTGDRFDDPHVWQKANPGLSGATGLRGEGIKSLTYMNDRCLSSKQIPQVKSSFMTKDLCLRATSYTSFLTQEQCHNPETFEINPATDRYAVMGFDLSFVGDLTACCAMFQRPGDDRIYEISHAWIPEAQIEVNSARDLKQRDYVPYRVWASGDHPWLTIVPGDKIDTHKAILGFIDDLAEKGIYTRYVGYDKWRVDDYLLRELERRVGEKNCFRVNMNAMTLSPVMLEHRLDLAAHRIINPSPLQEFARASVMAMEDAAGNVYPNKKELDRHKKIDPYIAELFAYKMLMVDHKDEYRQLIGWYPPEEDQTKAS